MTGQESREDVPEILEHTATVTRVVDIDTVGAALRELAVGQDSVTVVVFGKAGAPLGAFRTRTAAELAEAAHIPPPRPAPRPFPRRSTDARYSAGVQTYGSRAIPGPEMDAPGPLSKLPHMRRASHGLARGLYTGGNI